MPSRQFSEIIWIAQPGFYDKDLVIGYLYEMHDGLVMRKNDVAQRVFI